MDIRDDERDRRPAADEMAASEARPIGAAEDEAPEAARLQPEAEAADVHAAADELTDEAAYVVIQDTWERLRTLEERHERMRRVAIGGGIVAALSLVLAAASALREPPDVADAREFVLRDARGQVRARLVADSVEAGSVAALRLFDPDGRVNVSLETARSGDGRLRFYGSDGVPQVEMVADEGRGPSLVLYDPNGAARATIAVVDGDTAVEFLGDEETGVREVKTTPRGLRFSNRGEPAVRPAVARRRASQPPAASRPQRATSECLPGTLGCDRPRAGAWWFDTSLGEPTASSGAIDVANASD